MGPRSPADAVGRSHCDLAVIANLHETDDPKDGAERMRIAWGEPFYDHRELEALVATFESGWITQGTKVAEFEERMRHTVGFEHAVAVANGTVAIELLLAANGVGSGDEVILPSMTFFATAGAVVRAGATPVFVDIEPETYNIDPERVAQAITTRTRAIVCVDLGGIPCREEQLAQLARSNGLLLLSDGAQSAGATTAGLPAGSWAHSSTTSFHAAKLIAAGEGGMIFCRDAREAARLRAMRSQGETTHGVNDYFGTNARMTDLQASIGLVQLERLPDTLDKRAKVASHYLEILRDLPVQVIQPRGGSRSSWFLFRVLTPERERLVECLRAEDIDFRITYKVPVFKQPAFVSGSKPFVAHSCPVAEDYSARVVSLPMHSSLTLADLARVGRVVEAALSP
jgi:perosamine synthetase